MVGGVLAFAEVQAGREKEREASVVSLPCLSFRFDFLFHVNEIAFLVIKFILEESQFLRGDDIQPQPVLHLPLAFYGNQSLVYVSGYVWMYVQVELLDADLVYHSVNFALKLVCK